MYELINSPWPWYVGGPAIALLALALLGLGQRFGVSSSLRHLCAAAVPSTSSYFQYDWYKVGGWNLAFVGGTILGGILTAQLLPGPAQVALAPGAEATLRGMGITDFTGLAPAQIFSWESLLTLPGFVAMVVGGFLVGFGARWADGCTSGHAISGLAEFKASSLVVVIGFFAGGLLVAHLLMPLLLGGLS